MKRILFFFAFTTITVFSWAQVKSNVKFGKVEASDFDLSQYKFNSDAEAVIVADIGSTEFVLNKRQQFALVFKRQTRIKLINKNGFDAATVRIPLYSKGSDLEKLENLKATTYTLENGKVTEQKLDKDDVFTEKTSKNWIVKKFTFPGLKEGAIIEYTYTITSDFTFNLQPWNFQGVYPCIWSEYNVSIPEYYKYAILSQGHEAFAINKIDQSRQTFTITTEKQFSSSASRSYDKRIISGGDKVNFTPVVEMHRWVIKDVPGLRLEKYISSVENYITKIEFQLSEIKFPDEPPKNYLDTWADVNQHLLEDENFGATLNKPNNWLDGDIGTIIGNASSAADKALKILSYLRNNFTCTGNGLYLTENLKNILKNRKGNAADINLLLVNMLRHQNIIADPVILSTRSNGYTSEYYPLIDRFNYVICEAIIDDKKYYLDATQSNLGFGHLPLKCFNGHARVINKDFPHAVYLVADSLKENKKTTVFIENDEKGNWVGSFSSDLGYYESADVRQRINEKGKDEFFKKIKSSYSYDIDIEKTVAEQLPDISKTVVISYEFDLKLNKKEDIIYFNPLLSEGFRDNPFKSSERKYPVEMPFKTEEFYIASIDIPVGYDAEELPKSEKIKFNEDEGLFEYILQQQGNTIMLQCRMLLNRASFAPEDYASLRDFFGKIVKKQSEQFVFKKKK